MTRFSSCTVTSVAKRLCPTLWSHHRRDPPRRTAPACRPVRRPHRARRRGSSVKVVVIPPGRATCYQQSAASLPVLCRGNSCLPLSALARQPPSWRTAELLPPGSYGRNYSLPTDDEDWNIVTPSEQLDKCDACQSSCSQGPGGPRNCACGKSHDIYADFPGEIECPVRRNEWDEYFLSLLDAPLGRSGRRPPPPTPPPRGVARCPAPEEGVSCFSPPPKELRPWLRERTPSPPPASESHQAARTQPPRTQPAIYQPQSKSWPPLEPPPPTPPPPTQPPLTQPPLTQPPLTQPPLTQPPLTQPPPTLPSSPSSPTPTPTTSSLALPPPKTPESKVSPETTYPQSAGSQPQSKSWPPVTSPASATPPPPPQPPPPPPPLPPTPPPPPQTPEHRARFTEEPSTRYQGPGSHQRPEPLRPAEQTKELESKGPGSQQLPETVHPAEQTKELEIKDPGNQQLRETVNPAEQAKELESKPEPQRPVPLPPPPPPPPKILEADKAYPECGEETIYTPPPEFQSKPQRARTPSPPPKTPPESAMYPEYSEEQSTRYQRPWTPPPPPPLRSPEVKPCPECGQRFDEEPPFAPPARYQPKTLRPPSCSPCLLPPLPPKAPECKVCWDCRKSTPDEPVYTPPPESKIEEEPQRGSMGHSAAPRGTLPCGHDRNACSCIDLTEQQRPRNLCSVETMTDEELYPMPAGGGGGGGALAALAHLFYGEELEPQSPGTLDRAQHMLQNMGNRPVAEIPVPAVRKGKARPSRPDTGQLSS